MPPAANVAQHSVELIYVRPATDKSRPLLKAQPTRLSGWHVPVSTRTAASKAAGRLAVNPRFQAAKEQEYDALVHGLRSSGHIGNSRHTPATRQRTVQDLPQLHVSSQLAHAAELGIRQASNGYQLTVGIKPKTRLSREHLKMLKRIRGGTNSIWD